MALVSLVLKLSKDGDSRISLGNLLQCLTKTTVKVFLPLQLSSLCCSLWPLPAACPFVLHPWNESASVFSIISHQVVEDCNEIPSPALPASPCASPDDVIFVNAALYADSLCHHKGTVLTPGRIGTGDYILALRKDYRIPEDLHFKNLPEKN